MKLNIEETVAETLATLNRSARMNTSSTSLSLDTSDTSPSAMRNSSDYSSSSLPSMKDETETPVPSADSSSLSEQERMRTFFPLQLHNVISDEATNDIIRWLPSGKAFIIADKKRFAKELLPDFFQGSQFTSFTRKLTRWHFNRVPRGALIGAYYHEFFARDQVELVSNNYSFSTLNCHITSYSYNPLFHPICSVIICHAETNLHSKLQKNWMEDYHQSQVLLTL